MPAAETESSDQETQEIDKKPPDDGCLPYTRHWYQLYPCSYRHPVRTAKALAAPAQRRGRRRVAAGDLGAGHHLGLWRGKSRTVRRRAALAHMPVSGQNSSACVAHR